MECLIVNNSRTFIKSIREDFEIFRSCRYLLSHSLEAVTEMSSVRKIQRHNSIIRIEQSSIYSHIGGRSRECLYINSPFLWGKAESLQCSILAECFNFVYLLSTSVISCTRVSFGIFIIQDAANCFEAGI